MRRSHASTFAVLVVLALGSFTAGMRAAAGPNFSGQWRLSLQHSQIDPRLGAGLEAGLAQVTQDAERFAVARVFIRAGKEDRLSYELLLSGAEKATADGPMVRRSHLEWEGEALVLRERVTAPQGEATNTVHYRLLDGGKTLEARESFRGPRLQYDNVWVFERVAK
jgi:hypothetical protein